MEGQEESPNALRTKGPRESQSLRGHRAKFKAPTITCIADGCRTLAMIWESAWVNGDGDEIADSQLYTFSRKKLRGIYEDQNFLASKPLGQIDPFL
jgi:hypothetical protein